MRVDYPTSYTTKVSFSHLYPIRGTQIGVSTVRSGSCIGTDDVYVHGSDDFRGYVWKYHPRPSFSGKGKPFQQDAGNLGKSISLSVC